MDRSTVVFDEWDHAVLAVPTRDARAAGEGMELARERLPGLEDPFRIIIIIPILCIPYILSRRFNKYDGVLCGIHPILQSLLR